MKCINKKLMFFSIGIGLLGGIFTGCGGESFEMAYSPSYPVSSFQITSIDSREETVTPFAAELCVADADVAAGEVDMSQAKSAALFSIDGKETIYAKNINEKLAPASLTKIMTALVAVKYKNDALDEMLTASANVKITESGAQTCGLKEGDKMTLNQALHVMLVNSANDAAVLIAEGIGGSVEGFCEMMNAEAKKIGATNSNFVNPNGLSNDNHYVTAYDMYLIFNEARKYSVINEIIAMNSYNTVYTDKNGKNKEISVNTTNLYLQGEEKAPESVTVIGGKTGTTSAAGNCLVLLTKDAESKSYISVILGSEDRTSLYAEMTDLLSEIKN